MKGMLRFGLVAMVAVLLAGAALLSACAPDPSELIISPELGVQLAARAAGEEVVRAEPTKAPILADLAPEQITAGLPQDVADALAAADPTVGQTLAQTNACIGCHSMDPAVQQPGPSWYGVANHAVSRVPAESPALYLYESIMNPGAFLVPSYPDGIMPKTFSESLSVQDQANLVAYLLQQTQE
ncbi:MAG: cytochrome c [Anaerolineales bacterium]|nr:cytochrome c [Anaerolineales bacterium]